MAKQLQVKVPNIGDFDDVPVIEVLIKVGDKVDKEAPLITLESDKATMEVPAPQAGTVVKLSVKEGDKVSEGSVVLVLDLAEDDAAANDDDDQDDGADSKDQKDEAPESKSADNADEKSAPSKSSKRKDDTAKKKADGTARKAVTVPDIGDFDNVPVIEILVKDGDRVDKEAPLVTLESDKATMEVPAPQAGTIRGFKLKEGDTVSKGDAICEIEAEGSADDDDVPAETETQDQDTDDKCEAESEPADKDQKNDTESSAKASEEKRSPPPATRSADDTPSHASPSVRKFARELGVELASIQGSGPHDRILREDVQQHVKKALARPQSATGASGIPAIPKVDFTQFGEIESTPLARIRKLSAAHLHRAWLNLPHVTQTDDADITDLEAFRHSQNNKRGQKLTLLPIVLKAVVNAIDSYPEFAASLGADGETLVMKHYRHVGFAADTPNGLVVPVIRDVDRKGIMQLAKESGELAGLARDGKLKSEQMKGGVFTVSSLGGIGGGYFTPIINAPEVAILGVSRAVMKPVWDGEQFQPRLMLPLSLSYDHRVIDGAYAARFIVHLVGLLSDLRKLAL